MATLSHNPHARAPIGPTLRGRVSELFSAIGAALDALIDARSHVDEIRRLHAMSDDELARLGVPRDRIVQHVLRDHLSY